MIEELAVVVAWTLVGIQYMLLAADHGWLDRLPELRIMRPFVVGMEWLTNRTRDLFDLIADLFDRLTGLITRRLS